MLLLTLLLALPSHADDSSANRVQSAPAPLIAAPPPGGLDKSAIDEGVKKEMVAIRACYDDNVQGDKHPAGKVNTRFSIGGDGKVTKAEILNSELGNAAVEGCLTGVLKKMVFAAPAGGGSVQVDYPFAFAPEKSAKKKKK